MLSWKIFDSTEGKKIHIIRWRRWGARVDCAVSAFSLFQLIISNENSTDLKAGQRKLRIVMEGLQVVVFLFPFSVVIVCLDIEFVE